MNLNVKHLVNRARELSALSERATPGPWFPIVNDLVGGYAVGSTNKPVSACGPEDAVVADMVRSHEDCKLISAAPKMARLLGELADALHRIIREREFEGGCDVDDLSGSALADRTGEHRAP